jgi:NTP pyrophosphatase (non-canonical NTP hydrolase)
MQSNIATEFGLDTLAAVLHETAIEKGFWDGETTYDKIGNKIALCHSELTEVLEAIRKSKPKELIVEEFADVIIRVLDLYAAMMNAEMISDSLDEALNKKMKTNTYRPKLHGNLF